MQSPFFPVLVSFFCHSFLICLEIFSHLILPPPQSLSWKVLHYSSGGTGVTSLSSHTLLYWLSIVRLGPWYIESCNIASAMQTSVYIHDLSGLTIKILQFFTIIIIVVIINIVITTTSHHNVFVGCSSSESGFHLKIRGHTDQSIQNSSEYMSYS